MLQPPTRTPFSCAIREKRSALNSKATNIQMCTAICSFQLFTCFAVMSCLVHCTCDGSGHGMLLAATFADLRLDLSSIGRDITRLFCHSNSFLLSDVDFDLLHSLHVFCCHASQLFLRDL